MSLYSVSIRRPVLAVVFSLVILLFGIVSFTYLACGNTRPSIRRSSRWRPTIGAPMPR